MVHNALRAGLANGLSAAPFRWANEPYVNGASLTPSLTHFARFVREIDFAKETFRPIGGGVSFGWVVNPLRGAAGETVTVPGVPDGEYDVYFYRMWRGFYVEPVTVESKAGTLTVKAPELRPRAGRAQSIGHDVAFKIVKKGAAVVAAEPEAGLRAPRSLRGCPTGDAFGVASGAGDPVDVVGALGVGKSGVHCLDVAVAVGEARMAVGAGGASRLAMLVMAGEAGETFMDSFGSAVITSSDLTVCQGGVALIAESLAGVVAHFEQASVVFDFRDGKKSGGDGLHRAAVEEGETGAVLLLAVADGSGFEAALVEDRAGAVDGVAGEARNDGLAAQVFADEFPWPLVVERGDDIADGAVEVSSVATEAVVHQVAGLVVFLVEEDAGIVAGVGAGGPGGELLLVAGAAALDHGPDVFGLEAGLLADLALPVFGDAAGVGHMELRVECKGVAVALAAGDVAVG
jgi:hypothetical protein